MFKKGKDFGLEFKVVNKPPPLFREKFTSVSTQAPKISQSATGSLQALALRNSQSARASHRGPGFLKKAGLQLPYSSDLTRSRSYGPVVCRTLELLELPVPER